MRWYYKISLRLRSLFGKSQVEQELDEEIQCHLQSQIAEYVEHGMSSEEARYAALRSFGGSEQVKEECRDMRQVSFIEDLRQDLRFGVRMLRRNPGFSLLAILCLTLGIGANAAVFSWIEGILLRPFPLVAHQDRLVAVVSTQPAGNKGMTESEYDDVSWPDWMDFQRNSTLFDAFIADKIMGTTLSIGQRAEVAAGSVVSSNYFDALGVRLFLGRGFRPGEDAGNNAHPVAVISYWIWKERFSGDPNIVGKTQLLNGMQHTIIGVAPEGFYGTFVGWPIQFWVPASMQATFEPGGYDLEDRGNRWIEGFARLKPGVSIAQAQAEMSAVTKRLQNDYLATDRGRGVKLFPLWKAPFNQASDLFPTLKIALAVVFFVLLIACANVSNLLLSKSIGRRHEMTVRLAVGARAHRILRQLLTEGLILSTLAAGSALLLAYLCRNLLVLFFPASGRAAHLTGQLDWRVVAFSCGICLISTLFFGLVPAIQASKIDLAGSLKSESGTVFGARGKSRILSGLVLVQVSLSFTLLVGAVLLIESMQRIRTADPGFSTQNVLTTGFDLLSAGYDKARARNFQDALLDRVRALPGVDAAALARVRPFSYNPYSTASIAVDEYQPAPDEVPSVEYNQISPGYFATMGIPLISGREFTRADNETAPLVAVVNQKMVMQYWRGADPIGKGFQANGKLIRVIGVAKMAKYDTFSEPPKAFFYVPLRQDFSVRANLSVRTSRDAAGLAAALTREVRALDANLAPSELITMRQHIDQTALASQQVAVALLSIFGGLALLLAAIGLYGVMSYAVSQSTRELGLRMALGAGPTNLLRLVMSQGLTLTAIGLFLGAVAALVLTRLMGNLLYQMSPRDPLAFGVAFLVMMIVSVAACLLPAWRAAQTDPIRALRD